MRVLLTRPAPQADKWVQALRGAGLDALSLPLIEITGAPDPAAVQRVWADVARFDALMFVSANAVEHFFALCPEGSEPAALKPRCFVTGPGSLAALQQAGVPREGIDAPDTNAAQFDSEALWQVVGAQVQPGWRVLIVRGNSGTGDTDPEETDASQGVGRDWFASRLTEKGAQVEFLVTYARRAPQLRANAQMLLQVAATDGSVWLFSSSEAVSNLRSMVPAQSWKSARAIATHPRIAQSAREAGFGLVLESRPAVADLIASIESLA